MRTCLLYLALLTSGSLIAFPLQPLAQTSPALNSEAKSAKEQELSNITDLLRRSKDTEQQRLQELEQIRRDQQLLNRALVDTAAKVREYEGKANQSEQRLRDLTARETEARLRLAGKHDVFSALLAVLQRMGRNPPPAVMVSPDEALKAVHAAQLLSTILPEMREEVASLKSDLEQVSRLQKAQSEERKVLHEELLALSEQQIRIKGLLDEKKQNQRLSEEAITAARKEAQKLSKEAGTLKELIEKMEAEIASAALAAQKQAEEEERLLQEKRAREKREAEREEAEKKLAEARAEAEREAERKAQEAQAQAERELQEAREAERKLAEARRKMEEDTKAAANAAAAINALKEVNALKAAEQKQENARLAAEKSLETATQEKAKAAAIREAAENMAKEASSRAAQTKSKSGQQMATLSNPGRLTPSQPFSSLKGGLTLPVSGQLALGYGQVDGSGSVSRGQWYSTRSQAQITAPADGWVLFSGPFRSYGQVVILNPGNGYHIVLAGMQDIGVSVGQFVLAGEPIAIMGQTRRTEVPAGISGGASPILYIEFRKDGTSIDPTPWWGNNASSAPNQKGRG